jgi:capsular exopolysaccharide synthesis family protein
LNLDQLKILRLEREGKHMRVEEELRTYLQVLWRYKWMIIACAIIASMVALGISLQLTPLYSAEATLRVASAPGGVYDYSYISSLNQMENTYVDIATSDIILNKVETKLGLQKQPNVQVEIVPNTELIRISTSDSDPTIARDIANTVANLLIEYSQQQYTGNLPSARGILEEQLQQAKVDLDTAVSDYNNVLSKNQSSDMERLTLVVQNRQDIYSNLVQRYEEALTNSQLRNNNPVTKDDLEQARINLNVAMAEYNNALRNDRSSELESLERLINIRQQFYANILQKYEEARTNELLRANAVTIINPAFIPQDPSSPNVYLNTVLGILAGLATGVILAFVFEGMDDTLRGIKDVREITSLPILGTIPNLNRRFLKFSRDEYFSPAPAFDQLCAYLTLPTGKPKTATTKQKAASFLIASPEPRAGKSTVASNLAVSLAQGGYKVVVADMDYLRPRLHSIFDMPNEIGWTNYACGESQVDEMLQTTSYPNLRVVTAGSRHDIPSEWLTPVKIGSLLKLLGKECDYLLIDAPAHLSVAVSTLLATQTDAVILVLARRKTERQDFRFTLQQLNDLNAKIAGIVVNRMPVSQLYNYYSNTNRLKLPLLRGKSTNRVEVKLQKVHSTKEEE